MTCAAIRQILSYFWKSVLRTELKALHIPGRPSSAREQMSSCRHQALSQCVYKLWISSLTGVYIFLTQELVSRGRKKNLERRKWNYLYQLQNFGCLPKIHLGLQYAFLSPFHVSLKLCSDCVGVNWSFTKKGPCKSEHKETKADIEL